MGISAFFEAHEYPVILIGKKRKEMRPTTA